MQPSADHPLFELGAGVLIVSPNDELLIVQQQYGDAVFWGQVGGGLEPGETIEECAIREAFEETGLRVRLVRLLAVDHFSRNGQVYGVGHLFLARLEPLPQNVVLQAVDGTARFLDYRWVSKEAAREITSFGNRDLWPQHWP